MNDQEFRDEVVRRLEQIQSHVAGLIDALPAVLAERDRMLERELARKLDEALDHRDRALRAEFAGQRDDDEWWREGGEPPWN